MFGKKNLLETVNPVESDGIQDGGEAIPDFQIEFDPEDAAPAVADENISQRISEQNLDESARNEAYRKEKHTIVEQLEGATAFLKEIDINKNNIANEMFLLAKIVIEMERIHKEIRNTDLAEIFLKAVKCFQAVLISGNQSIVAERGLLGYGKVKNRKVFSDAINNAIVQAETITWLD